MQKIFLLLLCFAATALVHAQSTDGIGQVTEIESKAAQHGSLKAQIESQTKKLAELEAQKRQKLIDLQNELAEMKKQRDAEITDMKMGYYCSQCGVMKTEMEKRGENFEEHLKRVKGVPIPKGDAEIAAKRQAWNEKIAVKTVSVNSFMQNDYNGMNALKQQLQSNTEKLNRICPDIYALSQKYEERVIAEGKRLQPAWIDPAMSAAAREHIIQDKIFIAQGKIEALQKELQRKSDELREKIKQESYAKQETLKNEIFEAKQQIQSLNADMENQLQVIHTSLDPKLVQRNQLNSSLRLEQKDSLRKQIAAELSPLIAEITALEKNLETTENAFKTKIQERESLIKRKEDEVWSLATGLSKKQEDAVAQLRKQYESPINEQRNIKRNNEAALPDAHTQFLMLVQEARKKLMNYVALIENENKRMYAAAYPISCSVLTRAQLTVSSNFNTEAACMEGLRNRDRSFPATSMDCASKSEAYVSVYRSFVNFLSQEELQIIKANTGTYWFNSLFQ